MTTLNTQIEKLRNTVGRKLSPPYRPPSCDRLTPKLNDCPLCGGKAERHERLVIIKLVIIKCVNVKCNLYGPNDDPLGHKWNSIPRRSELAELLRLVDGVTGCRREPFVNRDELCGALVRLDEYADKLRKEWKL